MQLQIGIKRELCFPSNYSLDVLIYYHPIKYPRSLYNGGFLDPTLFSQHPASKMIDSYAVVVATGAHSTEVPL